MRAPLSCSRAPQTLSHAHPLRYLCMTEYIYVGSLRKKTSTGMFRIQPKHLKVSERSRYAWVVRARAHAWCALQSPVTRLRVAKEKRTATS